VAKKTSSSKRADNETKKALKTLRTDLKRLGRAISKDLKAKTARHPGENGPTATKSSAKKAADKSSTSAKKRSKADSKK
jgi:hypothetical protein